MIITGGNPYEPTTKIYDYFFYRKKIIAVIPNALEGYVYDKIIDYGYGVSCLNDVEEILDSLERIENVNFNPLFDSDFYTRKYKTRQLLNLLTSKLEKK